MATNKYFRHHYNRNEQNLVEDLIIESIQIYGIDAVYLPRTKQNEDFFYGEDYVSKFDDIYDIELYIKNVDSFEGDGNIFNKFGIDILDQATFTVARCRFEETTYPDLEPSRPREGDLIYFPLNDALFEIKYVNDESIYYQLGTLYTYDMVVEQYVFSSEELQTGIDEIDDTQEKFDHQLYLDFAAGADDFVEGEIVYQGVTYPGGETASAEVVFCESDQKLRIRNINGEFVVGENVFGVTSGISRVLTAFDDQDIVDDGSAVNSEMEMAADDIIDFSESNPFSEDDY